MKIIKATDGQEILVSDEDFDFLSRHSWFIGDNGYAYNSISSKAFLMHDLVFGTKQSGKVLDHIDRNKLNNQRENLRQVSVWHNAVNRGKMKPATRKFESLYVGVFRKQYNKNSPIIKYEAGMSIKGRYFYAGRFNTEIEAAYQRDAFAYMVHGHLAFLNFPDKVEDYKNWKFDDKLLTRYKKWG